MKYKRLCCAAFALMLVGASITNTVAVFADEMVGGEGSSESVVSMEEVVETTETADEVEVTGEEELAGEESEEVETEEASEEIEDTEDVEDVEDEAILTVAPSLTVAPVVTAAPTLGAVAGVSYDYEMERGDSVNFNYRDMRNGMHRCMTSDAAVSCDAERGGTATASDAALGVYTVTFQRREWALFVGYYWTTIHEADVVVYNLATSAQDERVLAQGDEFSYEIDADNTFGDIHTTIYRDGEILAEADGMDAIEIDTTEIGKYTVKIVNTSAAAAGFNEFATYDFVVYGVVADTEDSAPSDEAREAVRAFVETQIKELRASGEVENESIVLYSLDWSNLDAALMRNPYIVTSIDIYELAEEDWYDEFEASDEVFAEIGDDEVLAAIHCGYVLIYIDGREYGLVYELDAPIEIRFEIPEDYQETPEGYTRTFYVIRGHQDVDYVDTAERIAVTRDGNELVFENDKFSSFAIVFEDVADEKDEEDEGEGEDETPEAVATPETGAFAVATETTGASNVATVMAIVAMLTIAGAVKFAKSRK